MRVLVMLAVAACGRIDFDPSTVAHGGDANGDTGDAVGQLCDPWQSPAPIIFANTTFDDWEPTAAPNGGPIVFTSNRSGPNNLFMTPRTPTGPNDVVELTSFNTGVDNYGPQWNADGTRLYFERNNGSGTIVFSASFDGQTFGVATIEPGFASNDVIVAATVSSDETEMFYGDNPMSNLSQIRRATRGAIGDPWIAQGMVMELDQLVGNGYPTLSYDGNTIIWESDRIATSGTNGRWLVATRADASSTFSTPAIFTDVEHTTGVDGDPDLSAHDTVFTFASTRSGGNGGGNDIWLTTRVCH